MDFGIWILGFGCWILDFGIWVLDFGFWVLGRKWLGYEALGCVLYRELSLGDCRGCEAAEVSPSAVMCLGGSCSRLGHAHGLDFRV